VAKKYVTVSLSGTGGDELFGGYPRYNKFIVLKKLNHLPTALKYILSRSIEAANLLLKKDGFNKLVTFLGRRQPDYIIYLQLFSYMFRTKEENIEKLVPFDYLRKHFRYDDDITNTMNFDINEYLPDCLLVKEDRASMAVSLEVRVPFLDHQLVEFAARIPPHFKIKMGRKKYILKKAFSDILPREILYRRKQGFGVPLEHYFRSELRDYTYGEIFDFDAYDYYDKNLLKELWQRHQQKSSDYSRLFWSIMMFNLWFKKWMI
jgi:asparagine synthase (glutamine-hydrolysing)